LTCLNRTSFLHIHEIINSSGYAKANANVQFILH